ncbi:MAG: thioredoxin family protein, partial [Planctomycetota bacterium]
IIVGIACTPTIILFEGGQELGRTVGYQSATDLVAWMEAGRKGEELPEAKASRVPAPTDAELEEQRRSIAERHTGSPAERAASLFTDGRYSEAAEELRRVWPDLLDEATGSDEYNMGSFLRLANLLARFDDGSEAAISGLRDDVEARLRASGADWPTLESWVKLNAALGTHDRIVDWARRIAPRPGSRRTFEEFEWELLGAAQHERAWDVTVAVIPKPVSKLAMYFGTIRVLDRLEPNAQMMDMAYLGTVMRDPVISALHKNDGGEAEREVIDYLETYAGDRTDWRALFLKIAEDVGKLRDDHQAWIDEYDLRESHSDILDGLGED